MNRTIVFLNNDNKIRKIVSQKLNEVADNFGFEVVSISDPVVLRERLKELSLKAVFLNEGLLENFRDTIGDDFVHRLPVFLIIREKYEFDELPDFIYGLIVSTLPSDLLEKTLFYSLKTALLVDEVSKKKEIVDPEYLKKLISDSVHSINNILTGMQGYAELAQLNPDDNKLIEDSLKIVIDSANKVKLELKNFRAFVRVEAPQFEEVDVQEVLEEALSLVRNELEAGGIEVDLNIQAGGYIRADHSQMTQVLFNILYDLACSIKEGGKISIYGNAENNSYIFNLSSSDISMDMDEVEEIKKILSEPFIIMKDEEGLGKIEKRSVLSICNRIVYNHLGKIDFSYDKRKGLNYTITLPLTIKEVVSVPSEELKQIGKKDEVSYVESARSAGDVEALDMDILVVDDEEYIRNTIHYFFSEKGCRVIQAEDGEYALDLASKQGFDIIFMDYLMPKMGGLEAAKKIKKLNSEAKIVFITGRESIDLKKFHKEGVYGIIKKPFDLEELLNIAKKVALEKGLI